MAVRAALGDVSPERDPEDWEPLLGAATVIAFCALSAALYIVWHYWVRGS